VAELQLARRPVPAPPAARHRPPAPAPQRLPRYLAGTAAPQTALAIGRRDDAFEREAEAVGRAAAGGGPGPVTAGVASEGAALRRQPVEDEEEGLLQAAPATTAAATGRVDAATAQAIATAGAGAPLAPGVRRRAESLLRADLSGVRVHGDASAATAARRLGARAFTVGAGIWLGAGERADDVGLMAHEATHVVQQEAAGPRLQRFDLGERLAGASISAVRLVAPRLAGLIEDVRRAGGIVPYLAGIVSGAVGRLADGVINTFPQLAPLLERFAGIGNRIAGVVGALARNDCQPFLAAVDTLKTEVGELAGAAWDRLKELVEPIGDVFDDLWATYGAPTIDWIKEAAGDVWDAIVGLGRDVWEWFSPVREALGTAWGWVKDELGIGDDEGGSEGLVGWAKRKASEAWVGLKRAMAPIVEPVRGAVERIRAFLPLDAIASLRETVTSWLDEVAAGTDALRRPEAVPERRASLTDTLLPAILRGTERLQAGIAGAGARVTAQVLSLGGLVLRALERLREIDLTRGLAAALAWVGTLATDAIGWAVGTLTTLTARAIAAAGHLPRFVRPILDGVARLPTVLGNLLGELPNLITGGLWERIPSCIRDALTTFVQEQILARIPLFAQLRRIGDVWQRLQATAMAVLRQVFLDGDLRGAAWRFFSSTLDLLGLPPELVLQVLSRAAGAFGAILRAPVDFLSNLVRALGRGFAGFFSNIVTHLTNGLASWLFGAAREAGVRPPPDLSLRAVLGFVLELLQLTVERILERLARRIGRERVARLRRVLDAATGVWAWFRALVEEGPAALWRALRERLSDLWTLLVDGVVGWINRRVISVVSARLLTMLDPTGVMAVVNALVALYGAIKTVVRYARQLLEMVNRALMGLGAIARGVIAAAAGFLEDALARAVPVAIAFLAQQAGVGDLARRLQEIVATIRARVVAAIDWLIDRAVRLGGAVLQGLRAAGGAVQSGIGAALEWLGLRRRVRPNGERHTLMIEGETPRTAQLVLRSTTKTLAAWIAEQRRAGAAPAATLDLIERHARAIDAEKERTGGSFGQASGELIRREFDAIVTLMNDIGGDTLVPPTAVRFETETQSAELAGGRRLVSTDGRRMVARPLTVDPGGLSGSRPFAESPLWEAVNVRSGAYVRGHLLNHHTHGPGASRNLTPIPRSTNTQMSSRFEEEVKRRVVDEREVVAYEVTAEYAGHANRAPDQAEYYLPTRLRLEAQEMELRANEPPERAREPGAWATARTFLGPEALDIVLPAYTPPDGEREPIRQVDLAALPSNAADLEQVSLALQQIPGVGISRAARLISRRWSNRAELAAETEAAGPGGRALFPTELLDAIFAPGVAPNRPRVGFGIGNR
jgi:hypothetical protein